MSVCCGCCVSSGGGICDELITRPGESYRLWCVVVCDLGTSWMRRPWPVGGCRAKNKQTMMGHRIWLINSIRLLVYCLYRYHEWITGAWRTYWTFDDPRKQYVYMKVLRWTMCTQTDCPPPPHTHTHTHTHIYIYIYIWTVSHIYIYIYIYTHTHKYIYIYIWGLVVLFPTGATDFLFPERSGLFWGPPNPLLNR